MYSLKVRHILGAAALVGVEVGVERVRVGIPDGMSGSVGDVIGGADGAAVKDAGAFVVI